MKSRIYFLDNLRTFLIFLVVLLHSAMTYQEGFDSFWITIDPAKANSLALVNMYLDLFIMFTIFFISGYFIPNSLKNRNSWSFIKSKFIRIMLPWLIAVFVLIPAYKAIFLFSRGLPQEEWFSYFHLFQRTGTDLYYYPNNPTQSWLWFLPILFIFQILYLALSKTKILSIKISIKTGVILTVIIGLIYSMLISRLGLKGWTHTAIFDFQNERLLVYFMSFLLGSLSNKLKVFDSSVRKTKHIILANVLLWISLAVFTVVALNFFFNIIDPERNNFITTEILDGSLYYLFGIISMLCFLYILIDLFRFHINKRSKLIDYLNAYSYQVYIIHMIVMGLIATALLYVQIPALLKFALLTLLTFAVSNLLIYAYNSVIKKSLILRISSFVVLVSALFIFISYENNELETIQPEVKIHESVLTGDIESIRVFIETGPDLNQEDPANGGSPLCTAATFGKTDIALALLEAGADVNFRNNDGSTPLLIAAFFCHTEIVEALLKNGADKNIRNNAGSTALESIVVPFDAVKGIYDYFGKTYGPLGMELDYEMMKKTRPIIAEMLK